MPSSVKLAIVAALRHEVEPLIRDWPVVTRSHDGRSFRFFESDDTAIVCGGIGAGPARRATEAVIALYAPEIVLSAGFAGALDPGLRVAEILVPARVIDAGDCSAVETDRPESSTARGVLVTFDAVATPAQKVKLAKSFSAQAVDMEAAAVARAAALRGVRFAAVKAISDEVGFELPGMNQEKLVTASGEFRTARFARFIAVRPWTWMAALRLARDSKRAALALSGWLEANRRSWLTAQDRDSGGSGSPGKDSLKTSAQP